MSVLVVARRFGCKSVSLHRKGGARGWMIKIAADYFVIRTGHIPGSNFQIYKYI